MFSRKAKDVEFKITQTEFEKIQDMFNELKADNERLKNQPDFNHLLKAINQLTFEKNELKEENLKLQKTIETERYTARLVLQKLQEVTEIYSRTQRRDNMYITSLDVLA